MKLTVQQVVVLAAVAAAAAAVGVPLDIYEINDSAVEISRGDSPLYMYFAYKVGADGTVTEAMLEQDVEEAIWAAFTKFV